MSFETHYLCADFLGTISYPPALGRSELEQWLNRFFDQAANSTWLNRVCWSRLVAVNCIAIMMASLRLSRPFVSVGVSNALEVYHD